MVGQSERAFFEEHGWLILRGAVAPDRVARIAAAFDRLLAPYFATGATGFAWQLPGAARHEPELLQHLRDGLCAEVARLIGAARIRLLQDTLIAKPPGGGGAIDLHQDYSYTGYLDPPRTVSIRLALGHETAQGGCLYVLDGSNAWGLQGERALFRDRLETDVLERLPPDLRALVPERRVDLEVAPGDVTIHHCLTLHGSHANESASARRTVVAHVFDADCRVIKERLPPGAAAHFTLDAEDRIKGDLFPLFYPSPDRAAA